MIEPSKGRSRPRTRRSELERLVDRTVLEPTHPQLGTCWRFTGTTTPYGRIAKAQDSYTHRLGWKLLRGPIQKACELHHRCGVYACWNPDHLQIAPLRETWRSGASRGGLRRGKAARVLKPGSRCRYGSGRRSITRSGPPLRPRAGTVLASTKALREGNRLRSLRDQRVRDYVHRFVYRALVEPIPDGKEIDHKCHNADPFCRRRVLPAPSLSNPDHLEAVRTART